MSARFSRCGGRRWLRSAALLVAVAWASVVGSASLAQGHAFWHGDRGEDDHVCLVQVLSKGAVDVADVAVSSQPVSHQEDLAVCFGSFFFSATFHVHAGSRAPPRRTFRHG